MMQEVLRVTDRFYDLKDPDSISRQTRLQNCIVICLIVHIISFIAFYQLKLWTEKHPRIIHDVNVCFEFTPPPPPPPPELIKKPKTIQLIEGDIADPGSESAPAAINATQTTAPSIKTLAPEADKSATPASPLNSKKIVKAAPALIASVSLNKGSVGTKNVVQSQAPNQSRINPVAGAESIQDPTAAKTSGSNKQNEGGSSTGGKGEGDNGIGQRGLGAGQGEGIQGGEVVKPPVQVGSISKVGNIAPYRKEILYRIAQNWHPKRPVEGVVVLLVIAHDGTLLDKEFVVKSGSRRSDNEIMKAIEETQFPPLPEWYKGRSLTFKVELTKTVS